MSGERESVLRKALEVTMGDRNKDYGDPYLNHKQIADIFNLMVPGKDLKASDIVAVHIATKMSRATVSPMKFDHYVDLPAYWGIRYECLLAEEEEAGAIKLTKMAQDAVARSHSPIEDRFEDGD